MDPQDPNDLLKSALASAFASVLEPKAAVYVAVPVTSGLRLWKLASTLGMPNLQDIAGFSQSEYEHQVLLPNCAQAAKFAAEARIRHGLVIDPSRLMVKDWSQGQYWHFWEEIILRYAKAVLLSPEWVYSKGCVYECLFAVQHSIAVLRDDGRVMGIPELRTVVSNAIQLRENLHVQAGFLDHFLEDTRSAAPGEK